MKLENCQNKLHFSGKTKKYVPAFNRNKYKYHIAPSCNMCDLNVLWNLMSTVGDLLL